MFQEEWLRRIKEAEDVLQDRPGGKVDFYYQQKTTRQFYIPRLLESDPASQWLNDPFVSRSGFVNKPILTPNSLRNVEVEVNLLHLRVRL